LFDIFTNSILKTVNKNREILRLIKETIDHRSWRRVCAK